MGKTNEAACGSLLQHAASQNLLRGSSPSLPPTPVHTDNKTLYIPIFVPKFIFNNSSKLTCDEVPGVTKCDVTKYYTCASKTLP